MKQAKKPSKREKDKAISFPCRIDRDLIERVNELRKEQGFSWPFLTERFLQYYLRTKKWPL